MNILYISHTSGITGSNKALASLAAEMQRNGHKVYLLIKQKEGPLPDFIRSSGGTVLTAPVSLTLYPETDNYLKKIKGILSSRFKCWRCRRKLSYYIDQYRIDIVHTNVGPMNIALSVCQRKGIPHVWHQREFVGKFSSSSFYPNNEKFYSLIREKGNYNICITNAVLKYCRLSESDGRNSVIYDGVFHEKDIRPIKKDMKENYILYVGELQFNKAPDVLLRVFPKFHDKHPEYNLKLVGNLKEGSQYSIDCHKMVSDYHLEDCVEFLGLRNDVYELMEQAKALVVTSLYEGFGFITVEAMLNNTVVIGHDTTGTKEQFDIGLRETGGEIGIRYRSEDELLEGLFRTVEEDTSAIRKRARKVVLNNYTIERYTRDVLLFYEHVLGDYNKFKFQYGK